MQGLLCLVSSNDLALDLYNFDPNIKLGNWTLLLICELNKYVSRMGILVTGAARQCSLTVLSCLHLQHWMDHRELSPGATLSLNIEPFLRFSCHPYVGVCQAIWGRKSFPPASAVHSTLQPPPPRPNGSDRPFSPGQTGSSEAENLCKPSPAEPGLTWQSPENIGPSSLLVWCSASVWDMMIARPWRPGHIRWSKNIVMAQLESFPDWEEGIVRGVKRAA